MKLSELAKAADPACENSEFVAQLKQLQANHIDPVITGVTSDSRKVKSGFIFVAIAGNAVDGAQYIPKAIELGASVIISHRLMDMQTNAAFIQLDDPRKILSKLAAGFYPDQPETMVAVTGTAGKTSVASFLRQLWEYEGNASASIGTTGVVAPGRDDYGSLTTPDPVDLHCLLQELQGQGVTHAAMEASSHGLDQYRLDGVRLSAAGFTNLGRDHMDYHPTLDHYFQSKMRLFTRLLPKGAPAVIFADDPWSEKAINCAAQSGHRVLKVGRAGDFISLKRVEHGQFNQIVELQYDGEIYRVDYPLAGDFQISNGLVAAGLALASGSDPKTIFEGMATLKGAPGRLDLVGYTSKHSPAYVDYAHKPEALENVLQSLRPFTTGKIFCVFGCGGDRDPGKRQIMGEIASRLSDKVIVTDDNPRTENPASIRAEIMQAANGALEIGDRKQAIEKAVQMMGEGDCLVVAGKGHEVGQIVGDTILPFSDHDVLRQALTGNGGETV